jgi:hypothetical protein
MYNLLLNVLAYWLIYFAHSRLICFCKLQLERWADAVRDYEVLRRELPDDNGVAESLFHAQVALKKSRGEEVYNMKFGGGVEEVLGLEQFRAAISLPGKPYLLHSENSFFLCLLLSLPFLEFQYSNGN